MKTIENNKLDGTSAHLSHNMGISIDCRWWGNRVNLIQEIKKVMTHPLSRAQPTSSVFVQVPGCLEHQVGCEDGDSTLFLGKCVLVFLFHFFFPPCFSINQSVTSLNPRRSRRLQNYHRTSAACWRMSIQIRLARHETKHLDVWRVNRKVCITGQPYHQSPETKSCVSRQ